MKLPHERRRRYGLMGANCPAIYADIEDRPAVKKRRFCRLYLRGAFGAKASASNVG